MIDGIAESLSKAVFKDISRFIFDILVEFLFFIPEKLFFSWCHLERKKPRWDYYTDESPSKWVLFTEISTWIGIAFWLLVAWFINSVLLNQ